MQKGIIDRFRSLPMSRAGVLVGRTASDSSYYNVLSAFIMGLTGLPRRLADPRLGPGGGRRVRAAAAVRLRVQLGDGFVGLVVPSVEVINNARSW